MKDERISIDDFLKPLKELAELAEEVPKDEQEQSNTVAEKHPE